MSEDSALDTVIDGAKMLFNAIRAASRHTKIKPRLLILTAIWALYIYITGWNGLVQDASNRALRALDLWACASALLLGLIFINPSDWLHNGKRLIIGCTALAVMLGWLFANFATSFGYGIAPNNPSLIYYLIYPPLLEAVFGWAFMIALGLIVGAVLGVFIVIPVTMFLQIFAFEKSLAQFRYQSNSLAGSITNFIYWVRNERLPSGPPDDSKGARFSTMQEIQRLHTHAPESMAFGHIGNPFFLKTDKHVLIMASTRSGKGVTLIIPHLLRYVGSAFVLDPKGENAKATGRRRAALNDAVHYLDPFGISGKPQSRFNPLSRFTPDNMEAESKSLAAALFLVPDSQRDHWSAASQQLLAAIILYVYLSPNVPQENKDLPTVRRILLGGLPTALEEMTLMDDADGLLRDLAISFMETPEKEFGSVTSHARRQTEILDNPQMIACLSATGAGKEVDFKQWHTGTMSVFLCLSAPKFPVFNRWLRLVLTAALDEMTDRLDPPKVPVCFMLDELATLGHLASVENAVGLAAGYGIQLVTVFQDIAQMRDLYKQRWASFIGNSGARVLFNLDDFDTAEYWSKFIGGRLFEKRGHQEDLLGYNTGENVSEEMRRLIPSDKMMLDYASGKMLVLFQGAHPIVTDRIAYFDDKWLNDLWDDPREPVPPPRSIAAKKPPKPPESERPQPDALPNGGKSALPSQKQPPKPELAPAAAAGSVSTPCQAMPTSEAYGNNGTIYGNQTFWNRHQQLK